MSKKLLISSVILLIAASLVAGCSFLNKSFPNQKDAAGNIIAGTHSATQTEQAAAGLLPYGVGSVVLNAFLLVWNCIEKYKADKNEKGLTATLQAINKVKNDPAINAQWEQIKQILSDTHTIAGVTPVIQNILAKI